MPQSPLSGYKEKAIATDEALNTFDEITGYNNFYEFGMGKDDPQRYAGKMQDEPVDTSRSTATAASRPTTRSRI